MAASEGHTRLSWDGLPGCPDSEASEAGSLSPVCFHQFLKKETSSVWVETLSIPFRNTGTARKRLFLPKEDQKGHCFMGVDQSPFSTGSQLSWRHSTFCDSSPSNSVGI